MKIICDCGLISEFIVSDDARYIEDEGYYASLKGDIDIIAEHDQAWISCNCGKKIWIFT